MSTYLNGVPTDATGRGASFVFAASDSSPLCKAQADYVCNGVDDFPSILAAIVVLTPLNGYLKCQPGNYYGTTTITLDVSRMTFDYEGANFIYSGTGICFDINNGALAYHLDGITFKGGAIIAAGAAIASATATALHLRGVVNAWIRTAIHDFKAGTAVELETDLATGDCVETIQWWLNIRSCKTGIKLTGDFSFATQHIRKFTYTVEEAMANCIAVDAQNNTWAAHSWVFDEFYVWPYTVNAVSGIKGANIILCRIAHALVDSIDGAHGNAFVFLDGTSTSISIDQYEVIACNPAGRSPIAWQTQQYDFKTQVPTLAWTANDTTVANSFYAAMVQTCHTTVAPNERGLQWTDCAFLSENNAHTTIDWDTAKVYLFNIMASGSDVQALRRFQIKCVNGEGILAAMGLGIELQNLLLFGETYGAARGTVNTTLTLTEWENYQIMIVHYPGSRVEWYANGVLLGTYTTAANIPNGVVATNYLVHSIINGAAGGVDAMLAVGNLHIFSAR